MARVTWSREQTVMAFALYCVTPLKQIKPSNPLIIQVANIAGLSPDSLAAAMRNFQSLDPNVRSGASHYSKQMESVFNEYRNDWGRLSLEAEQLTGLDLFDCDAMQGAKPLSDLTSHNQVTRERYFFKKAVLSAYENTCYISGCSVPKFLVASHIKPFNKCRDSNDRITPENGFCLNTFYDRAFDQGLITITPDRTLYVSPIMFKYQDEFTQKWILSLDHTELAKIKRFAPRRDFIEYHNDIIFKREDK